MFDGPGFPKSLDEAEFDSWMEQGRGDKINYNYLLVIWDELDSRYRPEFLESREHIEGYEPYGQSFGHESLIAAYDLYSGSRVL